MTETEWLTATSPTAMLVHLRRNGGSFRKVALLGVACCGLVRELFDDDRMDWILAATERGAEGFRDKEEIGTAARLALELSRRHDAAERAGHFRVTAALWAALSHLHSTPVDLALEGVVRWTVAAAARAAEPEQVQETRRQMSLMQVELFREVLGNPFVERTVVPEWMITGGSTIVSDRVIHVSETAKVLAEGIQADQAFERLPILADALEEANSTDTELLAHLREPGTHVRGCWALDLVLRKK